MNINEIIPGRYYSVQYSIDATTLEEKKKLLKGGRGTAPNPLLWRVSQYAVYAGQAASEQMYVNAQLKLNPSHVFGGKPPQFEEVPGHPCIVRSLSTGQEQLRLINPRCTRLEWYVDGQPANDEQLAIIAQYKPTKTRNPLSVKIMFPYFKNLMNTEGTIEEPIGEE